MIVICVNQQQIERALATGADSRDHPRGDGGRCLGDAYGAQSGACAWEDGWPATRRRQGTGQGANSPGLRPGGRLPWIFGSCSGFQCSLPNGGMFAELGAT